MYAFTKKNRDQIFVYIYLRKQRLDFYIHLLKKIEIGFLYTFTQKNRD